MKIELKDLTEGRLSNLLSTATYGSFSWGCDYPTHADAKLVRDKRDYFEDRLAYLLVQGKAIVIIDGNAEGDIYSDLSVKAVDNDGHVYYYLNAFDIIDRLNKVINGRDKMTAYPCARAVASWLYEDENWDAGTADILMQFIVFGEELYR